MTFPTVTAINPTSDSATGGAATGGDSGGTSHSVVLPATVNANDLLLVFGQCATSGTISITGGGWTISQSDVGDVLFWAYRDTLASGSEDGTSITVNSGSGKLAAATMAVGGTADPATTPPEIGVYGAGTSTAPDPDPVTPTGGAKDYLWIWLGGWQGEQTLNKTAAANYTANDVDVSTGTAGAVGSNCQIKIGTRTNNATTENPAAISISVSDLWQAGTIAVHPAAAAATGDRILVQPPRRLPR